MLIQLKKNPGFFFLENKEQKLVKKHIKTSKQKCQFSVTEKSFCFLREICINPPRFSQEVLMRPRSLFLFFHCLSAHLVDRLRRAAKVKTTPGHLESIWKQQKIKIKIKINRKKKTTPQKKPGTFKQIARLKVSRPIINLSECDWTNSLWGEIGQSLKPGFQVWQGQAEEEEIQS